MRILTVEYRRLHSFGHYENEVVGATAEVADGELPGAVLDELRVWVNAHINDASQEYQERERATRLSEQSAALDRQVKQLQERWEKARAFLERHGVPVDTYEDVPF